MTVQGFVVRPLRQGDLQALSRLGADTFADTFGHLYATTDLEIFLLQNHAIPVYRRLLEDPRYRLWVAERAGRLGGYCVVGPCGLPVPAPAALDGELKRLYIHRDFQNAGLGSGLFEPSLSWLKAHYRELYISVYAENHGARRLYERHGFVLHHRYEFMVGNHADPELILKYEEGDGT